MSNSLKFDQVLMVYVKPPLITFSKVDFNYGSVWLKIGITGQQLVKSFHTDLENDGSLNLIPSCKHTDGHTNGHDAHTRRYLLLSKKYFTATLLSVISQKDRS
jgi:hypothetical protein